MPNSLMQHSIDVSMPGKIKPSEYRDYDFAVRTNFCNTFVLGSVLPVGGKVCTLGAPAYEECASTCTELHLGLRIPGLDHSEHAMLQSKLEDMQSELAKLRTGIRAYTEAEVLRGKALEGATAPSAKELSAFHIVPSVLR
jgi:hypothetical protein